MIENANESKQEEEVEVQEEDAIKDSEILDEIAEVTEPNLVINRVLVASKLTKDDWRWCSLFWTVCNAEEKLCFVIIDGGSKENFVSQEMVDKLLLKIDKLAQLYRIAWFKDGDEVLVT